MTDAEFHIWKHEELFRVCKNCKHNKVGVHKYPCNACKNHDKWEITEHGSKI